jgi:hypothetical protein
MEITCIRCQQTVKAENCYCPVCGLPQLVYAADSVPGQTSPERWDGAARDAGSVDWKPALRAALLVAVPAGLLSSDVSEAGRMGMLWMAAAAVWAVALYVRSQRPAWITLGAGARIGLVTGLLGAWLAFGFSAGALLVERFVFHQSSQIDAEWKAGIDAGEQRAQQLAEWMGPAIAAQEQANLAQDRAQKLTPEGHAGWVVFGLASGSAFLLLFGVAGGALGARLLARARRPEI